jgi:ketosteroid isomerase-like protein
MKKLILFVTIISFVGSSCQKKHDIEADKQALVKLTAEDWDANFLSGNPEANVEFYTEMALRIQGGVIYSGKDAIRTKLTSIRAGYSVLKHENTIEDTWISGDIATIRGTFLGSWIHKEWDDTLYAKGTWVDVCERQKDGSWKMVFTLASELQE